MTSKSNQRALSPFKDPPKSLIMVTAANRGAPTLPTSTPLSTCNPNLKSPPQPSLRSRRSLNSDTLEEDAKAQPLSKRSAVAPTRSGPHLSSPTTNANTGAHNNNNDTIKTSQNANLKHPTKSIKATSTESGRTFSSKYRGVTRHKATGRYEAHFWDSSCVKPAAAPLKKGNKARGGGGRARGKQIYLGAYANEESAARVYDRTALAYLGPTIARTNFPVENYKVHLGRIKEMDPQDVVTELRVGSMGFSRGKSLFKGVLQHHNTQDSDDKWEARLGLGLGKEVEEQGRHSYVTVGTYDTVQEAAVAYDGANVKYRGSKAVTNFGLSNYLDILENPDAYFSAVVPSYTTLGKTPGDMDEKYICDAAGVQLDTLTVQMMMRKQNGSGGGRKSVRKSWAKITTLKDDADDAKVGTATDSKQHHQQEQQEEAPWTIGGHALPEQFITELLDVTSHLPTIREPFKHHLPPTTTTENNNNNNSNKEHIPIPVKYDSQGNLVLVHDPGNPLVLPGIGMITELGSLNSVVKQQQQQQQQKQKQNGGSNQGPALWESNAFRNHHQPTAGSLSSLPGLNIMKNTNVPAICPLPFLSLLANNNINNRTFNVDASGNPYSTGWLDKLDFSTLNNNNNNASILEARNFNFNQGYSPRSSNFNSGGKLGGGKRPWAMDYTVGEGEGGKHNVSRSRQQREQQPK